MSLNPPLDLDGNFKGAIYKSLQTLARGVNNKASREIYFL